MNRKLTLFFVLAIVCMCVANVQLTAQSLTTGSPNLPPPAGTYISPQLYHQLYAVGIIVKDIKHQDFTANQPPPPPGGNSIHTFNSQVHMQVSFDGGMSYLSMSAPAFCWVNVQSTPALDIGTTRFFDTEMMQLNISGGTLPPNVMIRESPSLQSTGKTQITQDGANYRIHSFFDVFTELSIDGGATWMPATNGAGHMALQGDPEPPIVTASPNLPVLPSQYVSPEEYHQLYAAGIIVKDVAHDRFTNNDPPPDTGAAGTTHSFNSDVRMEVSNDGGMTFNTVHAPAAVTVHLHKATGGSGSPIGSYDTEMQQLDISGGGLPAGVMIRESPTLASTGRTDIAVLPGGGPYAINSFFDVFTELSTDGGVTWNPGLNGPTHMAVLPDPPPVTETSPNVPPMQDHYVSPAAWHQAYANGIVIKDVSHEKFLSNDPPPTDTSTHTFGSGVAMQISTDGGMSFNPASGTADVTVMMKHKSDDDSSKYFDTEMLQLDLIGLPGGVMVRESPSLPSKGKTSVRELPGGVFAISSFFDVFTELTTDGGMTWIPSSGPAQMELQDVVHSGTICGMKWEDTNGDGAVDGAETGAAGWKIQATNTTTAAVYSAVTDAAGNYCFTVPKGIYHVEEMMQPGWMQTGGLPYYTVDLNVDPSAGGINFGNFKTGSICGTKFNDLNGDGIKDPGELGLPGWTICIQRQQPPPSSTFPTTGGTDFLGNTQAIVDMNLHPPYGPGTFLRLCATGNTNVQRANPSGGTAADSMLTEITLLDMVGTLPPPFAPTDTFHIRHKTDRRSFGQIQGNSFPAVSFFDVLYEVQMPASLGGATYLNYTPTQMGTTINTIPPSNQSYLGVGSWLINKADPTDTLAMIKFVNHCLATGSAGARCDTCPKPAPSPVPPGSPQGTTCVITDANGNYCFTDLPPGSYVISEVPQAGWTQTTLPPPKIIVTSGSSATGVDFGNHGCSGTICVTKYYDENHNQQLDQVVGQGEPFLTGVAFDLTTSLGVPVGSGISDPNGVICFPDLPAGSYHLVATPLPGYTNSLPKAGFMDFDLQPCEKLSLNWLFSSALTDSTFRTATSEQWATALDLKNKRKEIKCKPDKVDFKFNLVVPSPGPANIPFSKLELKFNVPIESLKVSIGKNKDLPYCPGGLTWQFDPVKRNFWATDLSCPVPPAAQEVIQFDGRGLKGKPIAVAFKWLTSDGSGSLKGTLSNKAPADARGDSLKVNILRLPMPNLNTVGVELLAQGAFPVYIGGDPITDYNVVKLKKYFDAVKALGKDNKGSFLLHDSTKAPDCFHEIAKAGKPKAGLSPDKVNNKVFAEALALKLNLLASRHKKFPIGLDSLIYDYHKFQPGPFDGQKIVEILAKAETYLRTCQIPNKPGATPDDLYFVLRLINRSFAGPIDTVGWSCNKLELTGVRSLKDVLWLRANPGVTIPAYVAPEGAPANLVPESYTLYQNYPNPFNPTTTIAFDLPEQAVVTLKVYNTLGQEVAVLVDHEMMEEGTEEVEFDAGSLPSGVYFYRITAQGVADEEQGVVGQTFLDVKKMLLVK